MSSDTPHTGETEQHSTGPSDATVTVIDWDKWGDIFEVLFYLTTIASILIGGLIYLIQMSS